MATIAGAAHRRRLACASVLFLCVAGVPACKGTEPPAPVAPEPPGNVEAVAGDGRVTVTWSAVAGATSYAVYWATTPGVTKATGTRVVGVTSPWVHTGLVNGTTYHYVVTASNEGGESVESAEQAATPEAVPPPPPPPTGVAAVAGDGRVTVTWSAVAGATSYAVYWATTPGVTKATGTRVAGATSPWVHTGLVNGTTYHYVVTASNEGGESVESAEQAATPGAVLPPPPPPTGVAAMAGDGQVTITWNSVAGATSYAAYWATTPGVTKATGTRVAGVTSPWVHAGLVNGTTYHYVVTAIGAGGEGGESAEVSASPVAALPVLSITLGAVSPGVGMTLDSGGDVDTAFVQVGSPPVDARSTGNGAALPAPDGNTIPDFYMQFRIDDTRLFAGSPTTHVRIEVDYLDRGFDAFSLQYDAETGTFRDGGGVVKTGTGSFRTAVFNLCDAWFANRDNGADFRISDNGDGAEVIRAVRLTGLPSGTRTLHVDGYGASPLDDQPDAVAIQSALDEACSGDTVVFTSGVASPGYRGYLVERTLFLSGLSAKHALTFTASDPANHALLRAAPDLKGFVVRLFARSRVWAPGDVDDVDFGYVDVDGNRDARTCSGNWGSWLPECTVVGDPWCAPGNIAMEGAADQSSPAQDWAANPGLWTTGVAVHDLVDRQTECGTALALGGAAGIVRNVFIDTAGDHVHVSGCAGSDGDGEAMDWADGITLRGPGHVVSGNVIVDPSDVGIAYFGGKDTIVANNEIRVTAGDHGAFGGIGLHAYAFGDASGLQVTGNVISSEGDAACGGLHVGIDVGPHMWNSGCTSSSSPAAVGGSTCELEPVPPAGAACTGGPCQTWAWVPSGGTYTLKDNDVTGAHVNYLVEGLDLAGVLDESGNTSRTPRTSDWEAAKAGCFGLTWGPLDKVAHHPALPGWTDLRIHCER